jgi:hypothetical protein
VLWPSSMSSLVGGELPRAFFRGEVVTRSGSHAEVEKRMGGGDGGLAQHTTQRRKRGGV